jgi:hypothetical protein
MLEHRNTIYHFGGDLRQIITLIASYVNLIISLSMLILQLFVNRFVSRNKKGVTNA